MSLSSNYILLVTIVVILKEIKHVASGSNEYCDHRISGLIHQYTCKYNSSREQMIKVNVSDELLGISCNGISRLEDSIFTNITNLYKIQFLFISGCPIPENGFNRISINFRTTPVKQFHFVKHFNNRLLKGIDFEGLSDIEIMDLNKNNFSVWSPDTLKFTPKVEVLKLDFNRLNLYDNMFQNALSLFYLSISYNNLSSLPNGVFNGLKNLKKLLLTDNRIQEIHPKIFRDLSSLMTLNLSSNQLLYLDDDLFSNSPQLSWISISDNKFLNISRKIFDDCRLEFVEFYNNIEMILTDGEFSNFFSLELLDLGGNGLSELPLNLFSGSTNMKSISFQQNLLKTLPEHIFKDQENLEELILSFNQIETFPPDIFFPLKKIKRLLLDHNYLIKMSDYILRNSISLRTIDLSHNKIESFEELNILEDTKQESETTMQDTTYPFRKLSFVNLGHNKLISYPENSQFIASAQNINLEYNSIKYFNISSLRYQLVRKRELNLENNDISMIYSQNIEQIEKIHKKVKYSVKISHNPIYCDCKAFDLVKFLNWKVSNESKGLQFEYMNTKCEGPVSLKNKLLKDIVPKDLICQLDETCTERDECDCFYQTSEKTLIVDCSNNHLLDSPHLKIAEHYQSYGSVDKVEVHLEGNSLNKFSEKLGYTKVSKLFLQNNFINNVSWIPPSAQVLDMRNNSLGMLDLELLKMMSAMNIEEIHLGNNPWNCDCQNIDFSHFLEQHISNVADANNIKCNGSELSLMELNDQELCPVNVHRGLIALLLSLLFSFIIVMNVLLCYVYRRTILTWLYAERLCLWLIKEERIDKSKIYDAFVSFANQDEKFVVEHLVPVLEKEAPFYKLCLHMRDWVPGEFITTQINRSVRISRRTLVILSSSFLKSVWGKIEFRTAHTEALKEGRVRVIVIVYGDVDLKSLDDELKAYLRTNTYIQWGDPWFWEKLRYALPRRHKNVQR